MACKVFHRLALLIKMDHALSTQPFCDVRDVTMRSNYHTTCNQRNANIMFYSSMNASTLCLFLYKFDSIQLSNHVNGFSHPYKKKQFLTHIKWPCMCEPKGINRFSLRQNLTFANLVCVKATHHHYFHLKTNRQKLENHHVNGSQPRI